MEEILQRIERSLPCRKTQLRTLYNFYGNLDEPLPECVFIYGNTSTGKTTVVKELLTIVDINYALINLVECYTDKVLFETIINKLSGHVLMRQEEYKPYVKCDNSMDFIDTLQDLSSKKFFLPAVIVLDKAEFMKSNMTLFSVFLRLQELSQLNISVIFISEISFDKFYPTSLKIPIILFFPHYTKEELLQILCLEYKKSKNLIESQHLNVFDMEPEFYKNYVNIFLFSFYRTCRNLSELQYMAKLNFPKYCQPIINGDIEKNDVSKLWRHMAPILKHSSESIHLRVNNTEHESLQNIPIDKFRKTLTFNESCLKTQNEIGSNLVQTLELPFYTKYLLIAAYLASYNPVKEDKRLFMKYHGKKRKNKRTINAKQKIDDKSNIKLGPKEFTLDRLLAIFYAIIEERVGFTNNLLVQLSSLVELKFLAAIGNESALDERKYKCLVGFDFIQTITKMVGFNIKKYLYDLI